MAESRLLDRVLRLRAFIALAVVTLVFSLLSPEFLTTGNLSILVKHVAINAILAIGMTFVILSGGIDLSVGSIVGFSRHGRGPSAQPRPRPAVARRSSSIRTPGSSSPWRCSRGWRSARVNGWMVSRLRRRALHRHARARCTSRAGAALLMSDGATFPNLAGEPGLGNTGFPVDRRGKHRRGAGPGVR